MKTLRSYRSAGATANYLLLNALDHDTRVFADFAGDGMMIRPDLVRNV